MASIRERNGSYQITVSLGRDASDNQIRETVTYIPEATTPKAIEKEVRKFAEEFEERVKNGEYYLGEKMTFQEFAQLWNENALQRREITEGVKEEYLSYLDKRIYPSIGHIKLSKVRATHIDAILNKMVDEGLSPLTAKKYYTVINSIFTYAYKKGYIKENPCSRVDLPRQKKTTEPLHYFTLNQAKRFLDFFDTPIVTNYSQRTRLDSHGNKYTVKPYSTKRTISVMFKAYYSLAIYGGFRRGEICALTWEDVNFEKGSISIDKAVSQSKKSGQYIKDPKTPSSIREITLPQVCFDILAEWKKEEMKLSFKLGSEWKGHRGKDFDKNYVFIDKSNGNRIDTKTPSNNFKKYIKMYNDTVDEEGLKLPEIRLHDLRHTSATLLLGHNVDIETVKNRLGHSKASVTLDVYGHALETMDMKASSVLEDLFANA